ncbi:MAG: hypothetical protein ACO3HT_03690 [Ilumatobacteraceae bacterium]|jgi:hypothetical protein|nr:hypothetical protein [Actinomycetota bacterium]
MAVAAIVTLIVAALIVAAAALGLIRVILHLVAVRRSLDALEGGVQVIAERTSTVPTVLPSVNASLKPVRDFTESI